MGTQRHRESLLYKNFEHHPAAVVSSGTGIYLNTEDGRKILDSTSGAAVACLGYSNREIQEAMMRQLAKLPYCHPGFYKTEVAENLAEFLVASTKGVMSKAVLCGSGTEFTHLPDPQPERCHFIARAGAWHGATLGALALGDFKCRKDPFISMIPQTTSRVSTCSIYRGLLKGESEQEYVKRLALELDGEFQRVGPQKVCAFVAETVGGSGTGCTPPPPGYLQAIHAVCHKYGALLILDEVMCGMGRTGTVHAWEQEGIIPDIQAIGKGLGAGYCPISAVLVNSRLVDSLKKSGKPFAHGQTYMTHPLAAAAALRVQQIIQRENLIAHVRNVGVYMGHKLEERLLPHQHVGDIRGRGLCGSERPDRTFMHVG